MSWTRQERHRRDMFIAQKHRKIDKVRRTGMFLEAFQPYIGNHAGPADLDHKGRVKKKTGPISVSS